MNNDPLTWTQITSASLALDVSDDGTYWVFKFNGTKMFKVDKTTGQLYLRGGVTTDEDPL